MIKFLATVILCFTLAVTACSSSNYNSDEVPDVSPENLYNIAKAGMSTGDFGLARRYLEAIDSRYPFGSFTAQVQLDLIYVYYKERESDLALAQISRFLRLSPTHPNVDYVYYMKGLTEIQKRSDLIQDYLGLDRSQKDPSSYQQAFNTFRELIRSYPDSIYAADARQRMIYIKEELAKREMAIADYYFEREAYLSAVRHCQNILYTFRNTEQLKPALELMAESYERLHLPMPANNTRRVIAESFGGSYRPIASDNISAPIDADTGLPLAPAAAAVTAKEDKSWIDAIGDWIWGEDEEAQVASTNTGSTTRYTSRSASGPDSARTQAAAAGAISSSNTPVASSSTATVASGNTPVASGEQSGSWLDNIFGGFKEDAKASQGSSGPDSARQRAAVENALKSANNPENAKTVSSNNGSNSSNSGAEGEQAASGSWLDNVFGGFKDDAKANQGASGPESARQRAAVEAALKSANNPESAKSSSSEGESTPLPSSLFEGKPAPTNASGPESARQRAAVEAALESASNPDSAKRESNANGENIKGSWMEGMDITPANASGPESARSRAGAEAALKGSSSSNSSNNTEAQNIHFH